MNAERKRVNYIGISGVPVDLREKLDKAAKREARTLSNYIVQILKMAVENDWRVKKA